MIDLYEFKKSDAWDFGRAIGIRHREKNGQLEFVFCPYCHGGQNRDKGTFSISLTSGQFECKRAGCGSKGNMITLAKEFSDKFQLSKEVTIYHNIDDSQKKFKKFKNSHRTIETKQPAIDFLVDRGISEEVIKKYEITTMDYHGTECIVFPFKDETGEMTFYKLRKLDGTEFDGGGKERSVAGNTKKILFGMNHCEDFTTLVITEGQIDSLSLATAGVKNAVSVPLGKNGFTWKPNVWNWLVKFDEIVVFGDCENGEVSLSKEISQFFPKRVRIVKIEDYQGHKDANEILQKCGPEALHRAIENAEAKVSFRLKDLADVEAIDLDKLTAYPIGYPKIDEMLGMGFHNGDVIVLTGKCGEGKSTFASMIIGRMLQQGLKCFCYSGELPDWQFKAWLNYQLIGHRNLSTEEIEKCQNWYRKRCIIYDNSSVIDEKEEVFGLMEQAVRDLGCRFVLIDNLMTAMEDKPNEDLFRQQSTFLTRLTKFAKGFNIIILLIAHPKKGVGNDNDSISGSGDITNRATTVLRYQRDKDEDNKSVIMVTKNRTTGQLDTKGIPVDYDPDSMRITQSGYKCDEFLTELPKVPSGFGTVEEDEDEMEIPF